MSDQSSSAARARTGRAIICDMAGVVGAGTVSFGAWLVYPPAGFIVGGIFMIAAAAIGARAL